MNAVTQRLNGFSPAVLSALKLVRLSRGRASAERARPLSASLSRRAQSVPYAAVATAGVLNVVLMRGNELQSVSPPHDDRRGSVVLTPRARWRREGIVISDADGRELGKSPAAGAVGAFCVASHKELRRSKTRARAAPHSHSTSGDLARSVADSGRVCAGNPDGRKKSRRALALVASPSHVCRLCRRRPQNALTAKSALLKQPRFNVPVNLGSLARARAPLRSSRSTRAPRRHHRAVFANRAADGHCHLPADSLAVGRSGASQ